MIFKKLTLKNFMSYLNAEIDFSGIHVACLSGPNGAGKSSLLDAITWALWEEGRSRTDELIKLGEDEMSCELEFLQEAELYRVYRSRVKAFKSSQGKSNLEFQIFNPKEKSWLSLSMSSVRQTQELIIKTIKMDHETFVNSVYLRQGKADEFTVKRPNERKQILADILGLEVYDRLCESSRERIKELDQKISLEQSFISTLEEKILKEEELKLVFERVTKELSRQEEEFNKLEEVLNAKEKELNEKKEKEKQIKTLERSKENQESLIKTLEEQLQNIKAKEEKYKQLIENKAKIKSEYSNYLKLKGELETLDIEKKKYEVLLQERHILEQNLKEKISKTEQELAVYKSRISDRNNTKNKLENLLKNENTFKNFLLRVEDEINTFRKLQELLLKIEADGLELKHNKELLLHKVNQLDEKKKEAYIKIDTLNLHNHDEPCPLCKGEIKDKKKVIESYEFELKAIDKEKELLIKEIESNETQIKIKRDKYGELKSKIDGFGKTFASYIPELSKIRQEEISPRDIKTIEISGGQKTSLYLESRLEVARSEFQKTKSQLVVLDKEINDYENEINSLNNLLSSGNLVKEISEKLNCVIEEINSLKYEPKLYENLKINLKQKEDIVLTHNLLIQGESEVSTLNSESKKLTLDIESGCKELKSLGLLIEDNKKQIDNISALSEEVLSLKQKELELHTKLNEVKKQLIVTEQALLEIEDSKKLIKDKKLNIKNILDTKKHFEILEKAFSKNGIQAAVIETVVPEIEKEANRILSGLTENQMHVALKTQRERKSASGLIETLDIVIADNIGSRNYELYSGGEAFKINFSLRLALSRLLTNRVSARLQTLIIDEGFGSQDSFGKERLIEVIRSIQSEFELILVVTHLEELKEAFPVQIQVTKDSSGSKVKLVA